MKAIITGATKGIGKAITLNLAKHKINVACGARTYEDLKSLKAEITSLYPEREVLIKTCDFSDEKEVAFFVEEIKKQWEMVDIIINNVGLYETADVLSSQGLIEQLVEMNLYSACRVTQPFLEDMINAGSGHIINICSVLSKETRKNTLAYTVSKHALYGYSKALQEELREYGIKVTTIIPGSVNTDSWDKINAPTNTFVQPEDIANMIIQCIHVSAHANIDEIALRPLNKSY